MLDTTIISKVERQVASILRNNRIVNGALLVTAISGGPDSLAMFYALLKVKDELGIQIHGAHLDHCLRGENSQLDAKFVKELFLNAGVEFTIDSRDVNSYKSAHGLSEEEAAREIRYRFLGEVASAQGTDYIALGHTSEDQVETILMHIVRGSGLTGLRGMDPIKRRVLNGREALLIRPLLQLSRTDTVGYCNSLSINPRLDSSNFSEKYTRNKIRHRVLPTLRELNPAINEALIRLSKSSTETLEYLDLALENIWETAVSCQIGRIDIDRTHVSNLPSGILSHLLRKCVQKINGSLKGFNHLHIDAMRTLIKGSTGKSINMPGGVIFEIGYDHVSMFLKENKEPNYFPDFDGQCELSIPGLAVIDSWEVETTITQACELASEKICSVPNYAPDGLEARFDADSVGDKLFLRTRLPGDRFQPLGMPNTKKLGTFMLDTKLPSRWRDRVPIVLSEIGVVWITGWRIADWAKVTANTKRVLSISIETKTQAS